MRPRVSEEQKKQRRQAYGKEYYKLNKDKWRDGFKGEPVVGLYVLSNNVNDKVYVGVSRDIHQRIASHRRNTFPKLCEIAPTESWKAEILFTLPKLDIFKLNRFEALLLAHYGERAINRNNTWKSHYCNYNWNHIQTLIEENKESFCQETICKVNEIYNGLPRSLKLNAEENGLK